MTRAAVFLLAALLTAPTLDRGGAGELWSGLYVGGAIGQRDGDASWETTCLQPGFSGGSCPHSGPIYATRFEAGNPVEIEIERLRKAGYAGLQWQFGRLVVGVEGDYGKAPSRVSLAGIPGAEDPDDVMRGPDEIVLAHDWDASARGRIGFLADPTTLFYATAGRSWLKAEASVTCAIEFPDGWCGAANVGRTELVSQVLEGRTWGAGIEALIQEHWMLRLEYRRARYGPLEHVFFDGIERNTDALETAISTDTRTVGFGLAYKF